MPVVAIDPGNIHSAYVILRAGGNGVERFGKVPNEALLTMLRLVCPNAPGPVVIEMIASYGMAVGAEVFETVYWIGRFAEAAERAGLKVHRRFRKDVKLHHCHSPKANDANIRQALIDRFGGQVKAIGGVKCPKCKGKGWTGRDHAPCEIWQHPPGPLHGISADVWQALAVGLLFIDTEVAVRP